MTSIEEQLENLRNAIFQMTNSLGPHTPQLLQALHQLEEDSKNNAQ